MRTIRPRWIAALCVAVVLVGCDKGADLKKAAAAFTPPSSWVLAEGGVEGEPCVSRKCTRIAHRWETADRPTATELRTLMANAGWTDVDVPACEPRPNVTGSGAFCVAHAKSGRHKVELSVAGPLVGNPRPWWVTVTIQR